MTATTFDENERSASQSRPIDLYVIATPRFTYHVTSYSTDVTYAGQVYTATTMSRSDNELAQDPTGREMTIYLPITHPLIQQFAATGIPERQVTVTMLRLQEASGIAQQQGFGLAQSITIDGPHLAIVRVPSITDDAMKISLPIVTAARTCAHVLFDTGCSPNPGVDGPHRGANEIATSIVSQVGVTLTVASIGANPDQWAQYGEAVHVPSGERRYVLSQVGAVLTINAPFVNFLSGDGIFVVAGCDHAVISGCRNKFNNVRNFGGQPYVSLAVNPWTTAGLGIIVQP